MCVCVRGMGGRGTEWTKRKKGWGPCVGWASVGAVQRPVRSVRADLEHVHCARFAEALLFTWSAGPQVEVMSSTSQACWRKGVFVFIPQVSEPPGTQELTQDVWNFFITLSVTNRTWSQYYKPAGIGRATTVCPGLTFLS